MSPWFSAAFFTLIPVQLHYYNHCAQSLNSTVQAWLAGRPRRLIPVPLCCVVLLEPSASQVAAVLLPLTAASLALCSPVLSVQVLLVLLSGAGIVPRSGKCVGKSPSAWRHQHGEELVIPLASGTARHVCWQRGSNAASNTFPLI